MKLQGATRNLPRRPQYRGICRPPAAPRVGAGELRRKTTTYWFKRDKFQYRAALQGAM